MEQPAGLIKLLLPSLCLFYTMWWTDLPAGSGYHELFGNEEAILDVYLSSNPNGIFQKQKTEQLIRFDGFYIEKNKEKRISGVRILKQGKIFYEFESKSGHFVGYLMPSRQKEKCEPSLHFVLQKNEITPPTNGWMRAAFCL